MGLFGHTPAVFMVYVQEEKRRGWGHNCIILLLCILLQILQNQHILRRSLLT